MNTRTILMTLTLSFATSLTVNTPAAAAEGVTRRFALAISSHDGGQGRDRLLFSSSDAAAFNRTLEELGGLNPGDAVLLNDPDSVTMLQALDELEDRIRKAKHSGIRTEALVYYSGHADENGILLGSQAVDYRAFRDRMNSLGADVRIAVLDACASGALTRMKGGRTVPAFMVDKSAHSEGYAFLTSSSESEVAQESDRLRGSFFTHALNTGLRGAADANRDGRVTLHEAYQFAYHETLMRTTSTRGGPQHAGYEMQLSGSGDVVLTDIREATSSLTLAEDLHGRLFIRDSLDHLVAEMQKPAGREMSLGLSPGRYSLRLLNGGNWSAATASLREGKTALVVPSAFRAAEGEVLAGPTRANAPFHHVPVSGEAEFSSSILYDVQKEPWHGTQMALLATDAHSHLRGGQMALAVNVTRGDLEGYQAALAVNAVGGSLHGFQIAQAGNVVSENLRGAQVSGLFGMAGGKVRGFQGAGIFNIAGGGIDGWQAAGIFGISGGPSKGAQIAGIFNISADSIRGGQGAGIFNLNAGKLVGGQGAGIFNITGDSVRGGQGAGIFNITAGDLTGGQGAGIFNIAAGSVKGGQGAGIFNIAGGELRGGQGAGIFNITGGDVKLSQGAGIFNAAWGNVDCIQAAGIFNLSLGLDGLQIAPILNLAAGKVNGYQIGLINLADEYESGVPIGLLNISRKGSLEGEVWVEETGFIFTGLRFGSRWMHSQLAIGTKEVDGRRLIAPTLGAAGVYEFHGSPLYLETGLVHSTLFAVQGESLNDADIETEWSRVRMGLGWKILPYATVIGGLSYNVAVHHDTDSPVTGTEYPFLQTYSDKVSLWPGAWVGIRFGE